MIITTLLTPTMEQVRSMVTETAVPSFRVLPIQLCLQGLPAYQATGPAVGPAHCLLWAHPARDCIPVAGDRMGDKCTAKHHLQHSWLWKHVSPLPYLGVGVGFIALASCMCSMELLFVMCGWVPVMLYLLRILLAIHASAQ